MFCKIDFLITAKGMNCIDFLFLEKLNILRFV